MARKFYLLTAFAFWFFCASAQTISIKGKVYDVATNSTLAGANIELEGTGKQTVTDANGNFQFTNIAPGTYTIKIKFIGFDRSKRRTRSHWKANGNSY